MQTSPGIDSSVPGSGDALRLNTGGQPRLREVVQAGRTQPGVYGLGRIVQISTERAALIANVRAMVKTVDFEDGSDVIVFDRLDQLDAAAATTLSANEQMSAGSRQTPITLYKGPANVGFMPTDADNSAAGTGFALAVAIGYDPETNRRGPDIYFGMELQQLRFENSALRVQSTELRTPDSFVDGWEIRNIGLSTAIRDGQTLWMPATGLRIPAAAESEPPQWRAESGLLEWRFDDKAWAPHDFIVFTDADSWFEPSVTRDATGRWVASARAIGARSLKGGQWFKAAKLGGVPAVPNPHDDDIVVWSAPGPRGPWKRVLVREKVRSQTPTMIANTPVGLRVFGSPLHEPMTRGDKEQPSIWMREKIVAWPVKLDDTGGCIGEPTTLFDCDAALGPCPGRWNWHADHPIVSTVTLADGRPHTLMVWRVCDWEEVHGDRPPTEWSGLWVGQLINED